MHLLSNVTRHDILNQLTVLKGLIDLLEDHSEEPEISIILNRMNQTIDTINSQISFTRVYQEIGVTAPQWQHVPTVIRQAKLGVTIPAIEIAPELADIQILADPLLEKIFFCFLDNSERHGKRVTISKFLCKKSEFGIIIEYKDNGCGIPEHEKGKIFERGFGSNTGYGLFLTREIAQISGFSIIETGKPGEGARFEMFVPNGSWRHESP